MKKLASVWGLYGISYLDFQVDLCTNQHDVHLPKNQNLKNQNPFSSILLPKSEICNQTKTMRDVAMARNPVARWLWEAFIGNPLH
jgi:hypothetical protein